MIKTIAYLAPEIPSLSTTFIYNEILAIRRRGIHVLAISVREPKSPVKDVPIQELFQDTEILYARSFMQLLINLVLISLKHPIYAAKSLIQVSSDILKVGFSLYAFKLIWQFLQSFTVASLLQKTQCQHLHIHFAHTPTQIGMYAATIANIPFTFTSHANDLFERGSLLDVKGDRSLKSITVSNYNKEFLVNQNVDAEKINVVRCGINSNVYSYVRKRQDQNSVVIGSLARLVEKKGMDDLIQAIYQFKQMNSDTRISVRIAGDGPLLKSLKQLMNELNLEEVISFEGAIAHNEVPHWLQDLNLFVLACKRDQNGDQDGIPVVLMEAMAIGIPVISTKISGIPELIQHKKTGFLAEPDNVDSLVEALETAIQFKNIDAITENAYQHIRNEFDETVNVDRLLKIMQQSN